MPVAGESADGVMLVARNSKRPWMPPRNSPTVQRPIGEVQSDAVTCETIVPATLRSEAARTPPATCSIAPATTASSRTFTVDRSQGRLAERPLDLVLLVVIGT